MKLGMEKVSYINGQFYFNESIISPRTAWEMAVNNLERTVAANKQLKEELKALDTDVKASLVLAKALVNTLAVRS